jgi:hypothetical protein
MHRIDTRIQKNRKKVMNRGGFEPPRAKPMRILYVERRSLELESHAITTKAFISLRSTGWRMIGCLTSAIYPVRMMSLPVLVYISVSKRDTQALLSIKSDNSIVLAMDCRKDVSRNVKTICRTPQKCTPPTICLPINYPGCQILQAQPRSI